MLNRPSTARRVNADRSSSCSRIVVVADLRLRRASSSTLVSFGTTARRWPMRSTPAHCPARRCCRSMAPSPGRRPPSRQGSTVRSSATMPGLRAGVDYFVAYRCLIGVVGGVPATAARHPGGVLSAGRPSDSPARRGRLTPPSSAPDAREARSATRADRDRCNAVILTGRDDEGQFTFGRAVGVNQGSTGDGRVGRLQRAVRRAAVRAARRRRWSSTGPGSMAGDEQNLQDATNTVLGVYDPNVQHIGLGVLGPATLGADCTVRRVVARASRSTSAAASRREGVSEDQRPTAPRRPITIDRPNNTNAGDFMVAQILYDETTSGVNIPAPTGWRLARQTASGTTLGQAIYYKVAASGEPRQLHVAVPDGRRRGTSAPRRPAGSSRTPASITADPFTPTDPPPPSTSAIPRRRDRHRQQRDEPLEDVQRHRQRRRPWVRATSMVVVPSSGPRTTPDISTPNSMTELYEEPGTTTRASRRPHGPRRRRRDHGASARAATRSGDRERRRDRYARGSPTCVVLRGAPPEYGTDVDADIDKWIVAGLTGSGPARARRTYPRRIPIGGVPDHGERPVQDDRLRDAADRTRPARGRTSRRRCGWPPSGCAENGRGGDVKQGIIFETDGTPNYNGVRRATRGTTRCDGSGRCGNAAPRRSPNDIEVFAIAFDIVGERLPGKQRALERRPATRRWPRCRPRR